MPVGEQFTEHAAMHRGLQFMKRGSVDTLTTLVREVRLIRGSSGP